MPISTCGVYHNLQQCSRQELSYARVACEERSAQALHAVRSLIVEELKLPDVSEHLRQARPGQASVSFLKDFFFCLNQSGDHPYEYRKIWRFCLVFILSLTSGD
jgi:hypothetical protein